MKPNNDTPSIRFAGFTDAWEQRKFSELVLIERGGSPRPIDAFITDSPDGLNWIKIGDAPIQGKYITKTEEKIRPEGLSKTRVVQPGDLILSNSMSFGRPYIMGISGCIHDGWLLIRNTKEVFDLTFLCHLLGSGQMLEQYSTLAAGSTVNNLNKELVGSAIVKYPALEEQRKIGAYLERVDDLITLHQRKYDQLVNIKKSMLEKMFPKNGELVPEVRFAGFTDAWEQREFGEIVSEYVDPVSTPTKGYYRLGIKSHAKGTFHSYVRPGMELGTAQMHRVAANNFIVNITFGWEHAVAITTEDDAGKLVSHRFPQFSFSAGMVPAYFKYLILDEDFRHHLWLASPGGAGRNRVLKISEMLEYKFWVPSQEEQQKISILLTKLDSLITLHQRKLERLQNIKKACLEKMFV
ncbi:MAG: restriction endonuclease subunit S [Akkermansia sp.]